ncbi:tyrosine-type recombinase/integrase [Ectobacillus antri]|uniref:tyrosine-type recombinase/integrase n=1 Tax=Ectobacillus antri TaxID=2486280 RepID=UPI000F5B4806|nr:tyrosine-type recombinase/integrase [Ectobacillus antri]
MKKNKTKYNLVYFVLFSLFGGWAKTPNMQNKHLVAYVLERQNEGMSAATVKQDLAAVRYFHNQLPKTRYQISDNKQLQETYKEFSLERRSFGGVNRRCTELEYQRFITLAEQNGHADTAQIIQLAREQGLRIHEVTRLSRTDAEKTLRDGLLTIKGKGGLVREVPLRETGRAMLHDSMQGGERGAKLFVREGEKAHTVIQRVQDFIKNHRAKVEDPVHGRPLGVHVTCHSFRHTYTKEEYDRRITAGMGERQARLEVSELIGHSREDVTRIYLAE